MGGRFQWNIQITFINNMSKYYLLSELILPIRESNTIYGFNKKPTIKEKQKAYKKFAKHDKKGHINSAPPQNYSFLKLSKTDEIRVVYFEYDKGNFLIKSNSRESAYKIANIIYGFHYLYRSWAPDPDSSIYKLQEINRIPKYDWTIKDVISALDKKIHHWYGDLESCKLLSGFEVSNFTHNELKIFIECFYKDYDARESLNHLLKSVQIFGGVPNSSYYSFHYAPDRKLESRAVLNKKYFEDRITYETSFIAAFKGIERFFKVAKIKKGKINNIFKNITYENVSPDIVYTRYFEIFSGYKKQIKYSELIEHFLKLRNAVAAHGNRKDSRKKLIIEDNIIEIQFFLTELLGKVIYPYKIKIKFLNILNNLLKRRILLSGENSKGSL